MQTETYWSQEKVYFVATCSLFPGRINGRPLSIEEMDNFVKHFWTAGEQLEILQTYEAQNMLNIDVELKDGEIESFTINDIDSTKFRDQLTEYLTKFRNNELIAEMGQKPDDFTDLEIKLHNYLRHTDRVQPVLNPYNIWSEWTDGQLSRFPFWEIIFASDLISGDTALLDFGLSLANTSTGGGLLLPYANLEIINPNIKNTYESPVVTDNTVLHKAQIILKTIDWKERSVIIRLDNEDEYLLKESLRTDQAPHELLSYLLEHPGKDIDLDFAQRRFSSITSTSNLSEIIRQCGFRREFKPLFFDKSRKHNVQLKSNPVVTTSDLKTLQKL
jgi:hypothetical protein